MKEGFINIHSHSKDKVNVEFTNTSFDLKILGWRGKNFRLNLQNLFRDIDSDESYIRQTISGIIIFLKKTDDDTEIWESLIKKIDKNVIESDFDQKSEDIKGEKLNEDSDKPKEVK